MKALLISIKSIWCAKIMNGEKTIEVRKNKALENAIQKLINENGYADIYVYCSKINKKHYHLLESLNTDTRIMEYEIDYYISNEDCLEYFREGKVVFKFRCYKVDRIWKTTTMVWTCGSEMNNTLYEESCLSDIELDRYFKPKQLGFNYTYGYAIHISNLEIFDKPKELSEFYTTTLDKDITKLFDNSIQLENGTWVKRLTKAPQNFCYVEVGE